MHTTDGNTMYQFYVAIQKDQIEDLTRKKKSENFCPRVYSYFVVR